VLLKVQNTPIRENAELINQFYVFMKNNNSSERHIVNNLKVILNFDDFFQHSKALTNIGKEEIDAFLNSKISLWKQTLKRNGSQLGITI
jgi:hypothetical protein